MTKKAIVMFSGGLDSRLAVKIMQEQDFEILALFFKLPFIAPCRENDSNLDFLKKQGVKLKIIDCTKGKNLQDYLKIIRNPKYGRGSGVNPCIDCKLFMFKKAKKFADKRNIELIVSGEVLDERPMSQRERAMKIIEEKSKLKKRILRPLSAQLLDETFAEEKGEVDRKKLYSIKGKNRKKQLKLTKKFKIDFPNPAGGCLLCEKQLKKRFLTLIKRDLNSEQIQLLKIGRHFLIEDKWVVIGRNFEENKIIEKIGKNYELIIPDFPAPSAVILDKASKKLREKIKKLIMAYSKKGSLKDRKRFERYKL